MMLVWTADHGWNVRFFDVIRAFLYTPIKDLVFAVTSEVYHSPIPGGVQEMTKAVCGLVDAQADFDEHVGKVGVNLSDKFGSLGLVRLMTGSATFQSKLSGAMMLEKQMADGILFGPSKVMDTTLAAMGKLLLLKISCPQLGSETQFLGRLVVKTELGFQVKPLEKLFGSLVSSAGLGCYAPVHTADVREN